MDDISISECLDASRVNDRVAKRIMGDSGGLIESLAVVIGLCLHTAPL